MSLSSVLLSFYSPTCGIWKFQAGDPIGAALMAYSTAMAMSDPSCICNLGPQLGATLDPNPPCEAQDRMCILLGTTWIFNPLSHSGNPRFSTLREGLGGLFVVCSFTFQRAQSSRRTFAHLFISVQAPEHNAHVSKEITCRTWKMWKNLDVKE